MARIHADDIWFNGVIETVDPALPRAQALAIGQGRLLAVGRDSDVLNLAGPGTRRHDLHGRYVLPGFVESHTHALWGACRDLFDVFVGYHASLDQLLQGVRARAATLPPGAVIVGGPWRMDMRAAMGAVPRVLLDEISREHVILLADTTQHVLWCNSLALTQAGLDPGCPDIPGGVIERDPATGAPNGILAETASAPVRALAVRSAAQLTQAARHAAQYFNSFGFTAFKEPMAYEPELRAYHQTDLDGHLTLHTAAHIVRTSPASVDPVPYEAMETLRDRYASPNLRTSYAKLFLDGVAPAFTASFLDPYLASAGYDAATHRPDATLLLEPETLNATVTELDRRGFVTKMHAVGDNAVRRGLDAIAAARAANGNSGLRHEIAHTTFVSDADLPRFRALDAIAEMSPKLWFPNPATAAQLAVLGRARVDTVHRIRDLMQAGAEMTYASDWPASAPDANPWTGLAGMLSRRNAEGLFEGTVGADQAITLQQALPLFTLNGARSLGMEAETGSLSAGKWADFIVLNDDLATQDYREIGATQVQTTVWKGQVVFEA